MPDNDLQKLSPAYRLPASDPDFILSDSMQGVRYLLEFAKADERLRSCGVRTTIVVLGSARIREANGDARGVPAAASMARWYDEARRFGRIVSERGGALAPIDGQRDMGDEKRHRHPSIRPKNTLLCALTLVWVKLAGSRLRPQG